MRRGASRSRSPERKTKWKQWGLKTLDALLMNEPHHWQRFELDVSVVGVVYLCRFRGGLPLVKIGSLLSEGTGRSWFKIGGLLESSYGVCGFKIRGLLGLGITTFSLKTPSPSRLLAIHRFRV